MADEQASQETSYGQYAGFVTRLAAFVIDQLIVGAILSLLVVVAQFVMQSFGINEWLGTEELARTIMAVLVAVVGVSFVVVYNIGFWLLAGQTPGKRIMGVRIVRTDGERLKTGNAVRRWVAYWISAILFLGYLWVLVDNRRQAFHDKLGGTLVVYSWPEEEDRRRARPVRERVRRFKETRRTARSSTD